MTDIPIIFSAPMVQALLSGRKTMTRRLAWRPARKGEQTGEGSRLSYVSNTETGVGVVTAHQRPSSWRAVQAGDRLWVRENFAPIFTSPTTAIYRADGEKQPGACCGCAWKPSIHMPRWASRLTLIVTGTKVERLQDLSEADAIAEGVHRIGDNLPSFTGSFKDGPNFYTIDMGDGSLNQPTAAGTFALLWKVLHGEEAWDENPEVVAISFKIIRANIDAAEALAA